MISLQHRRVFNTVRRVLVIILLLYVLLSWYEFKKHALNILKAKNSTGYEGGLIDDVRFFNCYRWFGGCGIVFDRKGFEGPLVPWLRVNKNLNDDELFAIRSGVFYSTFLYVHIASRSQIGVFKAISDFAIARDTSSIPIRVLQDINIQIQSRDSSMFHDHDLKVGYWRQFLNRGTNKIAVKGEDWDYKGKGIWCKYTQVRNMGLGNFITNLQIFLGHDFVEPRPMWREVIHEMERGTPGDLPPISISMEVFNKLKVVDNLGLANSISLRNGELKILQLSDLHLGSDTRNCQQYICTGDLRVRAFVTGIIEMERPDLVIITGDVLDGSNTLDYEAAFLKAVEPMILNKIPYAIAWGNEDFSRFASKAQLLSFIENLPYSLNSVSGDTSLVKRTLSSTPNTTNIAIALKRNNKFIGEILVLDSTYPKATDQFLAETFKHIEVVYDKDEYYSLAFQHSPIPEYRPTGSFAIIGSYNEKEPLTVPQLNLRNTLENMRVRVFSCGQEHGNDCCLQSTGPLYEEEMWLCYGGHTGVQGYQFEEMKSPNVRFFRINDDAKEITSWKRRMNSPANVYDYQYVFKNTP